MTATTARLVVDLDKPTHRALKIHAAAQQTTLRQIVTDALQQHVLKRNAELIDNHIDQDMLADTDPIAEDTMEMS